MRKVTVRIDKNGNMTVAMEGVKGPGCILDTQALRDAVGETEEIERTAEYYEGVETETEAPERERQQEE